MRRRLLAARVQPRRSANHARLQRQPRPARIGGLFRAVKPRYHTGEAARRTTAIEH